jgi:hypothetical protein
VFTLHCLMEVLQNQSMDLVAEIDALIARGVDPTVAATTVNADRERRAMERTVEAIEADIAAVKRDNRNWTTNAGDKAVLAALINEKNQLQGKFSRHFDLSCLFVSL